MLDRADFLAIIQDITFPGLRFNLHLKGMTPVCFLQVECPEGTCNITGSDRPWKGRKWYLSPHMTRSEVIQTAFLAVKTAMEHETRERFLYKGVPVMDPHLDLDNLVVVRSEREPPLVNRYGYYTGDAFVDLDAAVPSPPYGSCPKCGASGRSRERRPNGNDTCAQGHTYPSKDAVL